MASLKRMAIILPALLLFTGCDTVRSYFRYLVVKQDTRMESYMAEPCGASQCEILIFTLKYKGNVIQAHCEEWDTKNQCHGLRVGETYKLKRDDWGFLSLDEPHVVLAIEKEHLE